MGNDEGEHHEQHGADPHCKIRRSETGDAPAGRGNPAMAMIHHEHQRHQRHQAKGALPGRWLDPSNVPSGTPSTSAVAPARDRNGWPQMGR
ncbi:hypothetical protein M8494_17175 [Serratia ureilytica]